jgi:hypothetical protein
VRAAAPRQPPGISPKTQASDTDLKADPGPRRGKMGGKMALGPSRRYAAADRPGASRQALPRPECRDPSPRCAGPCRIGPRSCAGRRAASCNRPCSPAAPHRRAESLRASRSAQSPPGRSLSACRGCSRSGACRLRRPAARTQNRCWSNHRAGLQNWRRTNPASVGADDRTAPSCAPTACRGSGRAILLHQRIIGAQQIRHRALLEPQPVQAPLAAGIDQLADQRLQDVLCSCISPARGPCLTRGRRAFRFSTACHRSTNPNQNALSLLIQSIGPVTAVPLATIIRLTAATQGGPRLKMDF